MFFLIDANYIHYNYYKNTNVLGEAGDEARKNVSSAYNLYIKMNQPGVTNAMEEAASRLPSKYDDILKGNDLDNVLLREINPIKSSSSLSQKEKIQTLLQFTYEYIDYQFTLNISLQDIILEMKGDCTEYAQLFVALARLNGIPAREVGGLVYNYSDKLPQFSGHAWAEVWMGDGWREVDPGWNEFNIDATHLRLSDSYFTDLGSFNERIELVSYE